MGVEINRRGGRHIAVNLAPVVSCNMYQNIGAMWEGFIKWIYSVASLSPAALVVLLVAGYVFFLAPFYWLWNDLFVVYFDKYCFYKEACAFGLVGKWYTTVFA